MSAPQKYRITLEKDDGTSVIIENFLGYVELGNDIEFISSKNIIKTRQTLRIDGIVNPKEEII